MIVNEEREKSNYSLVLIFKEPNLSLTIFKNQMQELIKLNNEKNETKQEISTTHEDILSEVALTVTNNKLRNRSDFENDLIKKLNAKML